MKDVVRDLKRWAMDMKILAVPQDKRRLLDIQTHNTDSTPVLSPEIRAHTQTLLSLSHDVRLVVILVKPILACHTGELWVVLISECEILYSRISCNMIAAALSITDCQFQRCTSSYFLILHGQHISIVRYTLQHCH